MQTHPLLQLDEGEGDHRNCVFNFKALKKKRDRNFLEYEFIAQTNFAITPPRVHGVKKATDLYIHSIGIKYPTIFLLRSPVLLSSLDR